MPPQQADDKPEVQAITIRLPKDMYEDLRRQAFDQRTSINALIIAAVQQVNRVGRNVPCHAMSRPAEPRRAGS